MLKKIAIEQLRPGMHLHRLEGPWLSHPFWKTSFAVDADALRRLAGGPVSECWIDTARGPDVEAAASPAASEPRAAVPLPAAPVSERPLHEELRQAAAICQRARGAVVAMFAEARLGRAVDAESCLPIVEEIAGSVQRNPGAMVSLARLKSRDDYSYMHSVAVCALMVALARQLGHDGEQCRQAGLAGLLHDIGKALMPPELLNKPGRLTDAEFAVIRSHPERGHALLAEAGHAGADALDVVLHHHEKIDGSGYPHGLAGDAISRLARMGAICDVYDAITSNRPYKAGWDPAESLARMSGWKGHLDEAMFGAFVQSLGIYPVGSRVRLESGRLAVVVAQNAHDLLAPVVKVFYSSRSKMRITPDRIDLSRRGCHDRIVGRDAGEEGSFTHLDELWAEPDLLRRMKAAA